VKYRRFIIISLPLLNTKVI